MEFIKDRHQHKPETVYLLTSLSEKEATPERLLELNRGHWGIQNRIHRVRNVAMGEERSRIRKKTLPRLMGTTNISRRMSQLRMKPDEAVCLLFGSTCIF